MISTQIVSLLVKERKRQGLSQAEVASRMGVNSSYVQKIEYNTQDRKVSTFDRYAAALGIELEVSLGEQQSVQGRG